MSARRCSVPVECRCEREGDRERSSGVNIDEILRLIIKSSFNQCGATHQDIAPVHVCVEMAGSGE